VTVPVVAANAAKKTVAKKAAAKKATAAAKKAPGKKAAAKKTTAAAGSGAEDWRTDPEVLRRQADARRKLDAEKAAAAPEAPEAPAPETAAAAPGGRSWSMPRPAAGGAVDTGSGMLLGIILWAVASNWIRGGRAQAMGWVKAKLTNKTFKPTGAGTIAPATPQAPAQPTKSA